MGLSTLYNISRSPINSPRLLHNKLLCSLWLLEKKYTFSTIVGLILICSNKKSTQTTDALLRKLYVKLFISYDDQLFSDTGLICSKVATYIHTPLLPFCILITIKTKIVQLVRTLISCINNENSNFSLG